MQKGKEGQSVHKPGPSETSPNHPCVQGTVGKSTGQFRESSANSPRMSRGCVSGLDLFLEIRKIWVHRRPRLNGTMQAHRASSTRERWDLKSCDPASLIKPTGVSSKLKPDWQGGHSGFLPGWPLRCSGKAGQPPQGCDWDEGRLGRKTHTMHWILPIPVLGARA